MIRDPQSFATLLAEVRQFIRNECMPLEQQIDQSDEIPEPHGFDVCVRIGAESASCQFAEHAHGHDDAMSRDNNMRAAVMHVIADAAVSVLVIAAGALCLE